MMSVLKEDSPPAKTARGNQSRQRILDASLDIVLEGGMDALSVSAICSRVNISPTSIYHHFGSKTGLLSELIMFSMERSRKRFQERLGVHSEIKDRLDAYVDTIREVVMSRESGVRIIINALARSKQKTPEVMEMIELVRATQWRVNAEAFEQLVGVRGGEILAHTMAAFSSYVFQVYHEGRDPKFMDQLLASLRVLIQLIVDAEGNPPPPPQFAERAAHVRQDS